jgi:phosphotransferase system HPr (HPr) family protein
VRELTHIILDSEGLHARNAVLLTAEAKKWRSKIEIAVGFDRSEASDLLGLMALDACAGDQMIVRIEGPDEVEATIAIAELLDASI